MSAPARWNGPYLPNQTSSTSTRKGTGTRRTGTGGRSAGTSAGRTGGGRGAAHTPARTSTPARTGTATRTRTRSSGERPVRTTADRGRSTSTGRSSAANRAYARRDQRAARTGGAARQRTGVVSKARFVVVVMGLLVVGLVATLWLSTQSVADSLRLQETREHNSELSEQVERLRSEVGRMESPTELAKLAERLGLVPPPDPARLQVAPDGSVTEYGTPTPATAPQPSAPPADQQQQQQQQQSGGG
ncbi:hypothetical protein [Goodfellowiella coeruleoviolacea]|uniref:Cell division protein FtsL n=1 Tax=Goodfellowiella coeruleoviolacea TaxID=334858 RepID=A0AAE3KKN5_9PSEU|nr:hypothetical protein [Goodfellowiella coeruleoviolacea]MCP2169549.1 hypothetical protein [Goodfellowiella coeruleoviolacea]